MLCKELHIVLIEFPCWYFPYIFIQSLLALFLVTQTNWVQNSLPKYTVCLCRQERLITPQNLLCLWSKITRNASLSMVCSHVRPLNLCQMPLRNFGQKRELQYLENMFCYVGFSNSLLSRTVKFTICGVTFLRIQSNWLGSNYFSQTPGCYAARKNL